MYFNLFSTCVLIEGYSVSLIYDLDRMEKYEVPKHVGELLNLSKRKPIAELCEELEETEENIKEFFSQFVHSELGFFTTSPDRFPEIEFVYESPFKITNAILEIDSIFSYNVQDVLAELNVLGCRAIQFFYRCQLKDANPAIFLDHVCDSRINQVEFLIPFANDMQESDYWELAANEPRISRFLIYAAPEDRVVVSNNAQFDKLIIYRQKDIRNDPEEIISPDRFTINIEVFAEAQSHNLGLNQKVCIDKNGNIKNYLAHEKIFANTNNTTIQSIIENPEFQINWNISNDKIEICKECQYRYCCVSNSDIIFERGKYYKKNMCGFDPFKNLWAETKKKK